MTTTTDINVFHNMKLENPRRLRFAMSPVRVTYANTLRRAIQTEVPTLGFRADITESGSTSDVKIIKNSTPMSNEMLADRVGLLPIAMQPNAATWDKDFALFSLHVVNNTDEVRIVTASDFEVLEKGADGGDRQKVANTKYFHPDPVTGETCILAVLKPQVAGQKAEEVHIEAYASMGTGREHTRFNPTSQCSYAYTRDENPERVNKLFNTWLIEQKKVMPAELNSDANRKARLETEFRSLEIHRCFKMDNEGEPYSFDFTIETVGTMNVLETVEIALGAIGNLCNRYATIHEGDLPEHIDIRPTTMRMVGLDVFIRGEDHTLGNLLQTWLDDYRVGQGPQKGRGLTFVGNCVPHPLRDELKLTFGFSDLKYATHDNVRLLISEAAQACGDMYRSWIPYFLQMLEEYGVIEDKPTVEDQVKGPWDAHAKIKGEQAAIVEALRKKKEEEKEAGKPTLAKKRSAAAAKVATKKPTA